MKEDRDILTFRHIMVNHGAETQLEIRETGFKIISSNLTTLWQLYRTFQHYINDFLGNKEEVINVDDLRGECAILEVS